MATDEDWGSSATRRQDRSRRAEIAAQAPRAGRRLEILANAVDVASDSDYLKSIYSCL
jgi:hypothetical protein